MFRRKSEKQRMRRTLEERSIRNFFSNSIVIRWLIGCAFVAGLILLSFFGGSLESTDLSVGQISPRTIMARVNFEFEDSDATQSEANRRAEVARNFYRLNPDVSDKSLNRIKHLLEKIASTKQGGKISENRLKQIADSWNEWSNIQLTTGDIQALIPLSDKKVFLDSLLDLTAKFVKNGILGDNEFSNPDTIIAFGSEPDDFSQVRIAKVSQFLTITQARQRLMEQLSASVNLPVATSAAVQKLANDLIAPSLQLDIPLSAKYQELQRKSVNPVRRSVSKGDVLIDRGERVIESKMKLLKAHDAEASKEFTKQGQIRQWFGQFLLILIVLGVALLCSVHTRRDDTPLSNLEYGLLATVILLHFFICKLILFLTATYTLLGPAVMFALLPACFGPMLIAILINRRQGRIAAFLCTFLAAMATQFNMTFILSSIISALVGIHHLSSLRRRTRIYEAGLLAGGVSGLVSLIYGFIWNIPWPVLGVQAGTCIAAAFVASLMIAALLPLFEILFKVTTDLRWLELSDLNHPLLRRMIMEAPGTYHHSLIVANLAERACEAIGAHALQARVCSYFHDIGKMNKPEYFCENQVGVENPHDDIEPNMSALIIISHVKDGVDMAIQYGLARPIIDSIQQHHGTSQVTYFYRMAKRNEEEARLGSKIMRMNVSDVPRVDEETYRYPGPRSQTRELAIISLADAVEGASRCILKPTPQKIEALITEIIEERYRDGQLDECPLSLRDLKKVSESFSKTILSMMHTRVSYPKDESNSDESPSMPAPSSQKMA
jgi:putative nucleotidyltransferase with HDIG domain